jgi:hypothetical protein
MRSAAVAVKHSVAHRKQATHDASSGSGELTLGKEGRPLAQT